jgi:hypothetical protein
METAPRCCEGWPADQYRRDAGYELGNIPLGWVERFESDGENQAAGGSQCKRQAQCQGALLRVAQ